VDNGSILTSGGVTAGVDLSLHMLRKDFGAETANHVARRILAAPSRDGGQTQFIELPSAPPGDDVLADTQRWMLANLHTNITVADMADHAHLSPRHFHRLFAKRMATTPLSWLLSQRIERTKGLLENTDLPVEEIARHVGLGTAANLRSHFRRATSLSPGRYRAGFAAAAPGASTPVGTMP
jgi:transcriptional regulator GlxA family with amidase domain